MGCRHAKGDICLILNNNGKCAMIYDQNEESCSKRAGGIIHYLKYLGTYDKMVKNNPEYLAIAPEVPEHKKIYYESVHERKLNSIKKNVILKSIKSH